jgi:prepilin-type N-terminal cleavage/methylation domain-containing protein
MDRVKHQKQGFSLIELSIALVIIGLIVGGIFVGTDMVKGAEIRSTIGQLESYKNAVHSFKAKYKCLPGDCSNAANKGLSAATGYSDVGNDNGLIADNQSTALAGAGNTHLHHEAANFWAHLQNAGMVTFPPGTGSYYPMPLSSLGRGHWSVWVGPLPENALYITEQWGGNLATSQSRCEEAFCPSLSPVEAFQIDKKIDDGLPDPLLNGVFASAPGDPYSGGGQIGKVNALFPYTSLGQILFRSSVSQGAAGSNNCLDSSKTPVAYNSQVSTPNLCLLQFRMDY